MDQDITFYSYTWPWKLTCAPLNISTILYLFENFYCMESGSFPGDYLLKIYTGHPPVASSHLSYCPNTYSYRDVLNILPHNTYLILC